MYVDAADEIPMIVIEMELLTVLTHVVIHQHIILMQIPMVM